MAFIKNNQPTLSSAIAVKYRAYKLNLKLNKINFNLK